MARRIAVIDYGTGNLKSVVKAFEHLGASVSLIRKPEDVGEIDAIVFPGQGSYDQCMNCLMQSGLDLLVKNWIQDDRPFFWNMFGPSSSLRLFRRRETTRVGSIQGPCSTFLPFP